MPFRNTTFWSVDIKHKVSDLIGQIYMILFGCIVFFCVYVLKKIIFKVYLAFSESFSLRNDMKLRERVVGFDF